MRNKFTIVGCLFLLSLSSCGQADGHVEQVVADSIVVNQINENRLRFDEKVKEAFHFCEANGLNTDFCVLIDMKIHSGRNRMFVYDFKQQKVDHSALCAHGSGKGENQSTVDQPIFSNVEGSLLSSLGKYKIGARAYSQWGINVHYKLHGLEDTNNNAYKRIVVLHSHTPVPSAEIHPNHLPLGWSWGCPVTDDETMTYLDNKLKTASNPVLLWIYY